MRHTNFTTAPKCSNTTAVTGKVPTSRFVHRLGLQEAKNKGEVVFCSFRQHEAHQQYVSILHETLSLIKKASLLSIHIKPILRERVLNKDHHLNHADLVG